MDSISRISQFLFGAAGRNNNTTLYISSHFSSWFPWEWWLDLDLTTSHIQVALFCLVLLLWLGSKICLGGQGHTLGEDNIPVASFFPFPVPNFMNGLYLTRRYRQVGLAVLEELVSKFGTFGQASIGFVFGSIYGIADPSIAQSILSSSSPSYLNKPREIYGQIFQAESNHGLATLEYDVWLKHRKVLAHSFTYSSLQASLRIMDEHAGQLTGKLLTASKSGTGGLVRGKPVLDLIWSETIKLIWQTTIGTDCCSDEESAVIQNGLHRYKDILQTRFQYPVLFLRPIWWLHPGRAEQHRILSNFREIITKKITLVRERGSGPGQSGTHSTLIEPMINSGASDLEIFAEIITFVMAGHETTASAITYLLFQLACNPGCQTLARDEVSKLWDGTRLHPGDNSLQMSDLSQLKYLERCIFESLRMVPVLPVIYRRLDASLELGDGKPRFEKGRTVAISPWAIHFNPNIFPEPEKFDPDRFLPVNVQKRHPYAYLPFSAGPRNCIGYKYAMMEMKIILAWLLHHFEISTGVAEPKSVKYSAGITATPDKDLDIILKRR